MAVFEGIKQITFGGNVYKLAGGSDSGASGDEYDGPVGTVTVNDAVNFAFPSSVFVSGTIDVAGYSAYSITNPIKATINGVSIASYGLSGIFDLDCDENVLHIGDMALAGLLGGTNVNLPACKTIGQYAFYSAGSITVNAPECEQIGSGAFNNARFSSFSFPRCKKIFGGAFASAWMSGDYIHEFSFPNVTDVYANAFGSHCMYVNLPKCEHVHFGTFSAASSLVSINIPDCRIIDGRAFYSCSSLSSINIPNCEQIGDDAFYGCYLLSSVSLPALKTIGVNAFAGTSVTYLDLPECEAIYGNPFSYAVYESTARFSALSIPKCKHIGGSVFEFANDMPSVVEFSLCKNIGSRAFRNTNVVSISLPLCKYIGSSAFANCSSMTSMTLPECIVIDQGAFENCKSLSAISAQNCETVGTVAFKACGLNGVSLPRCKYVGYSAFDSNASLTFASLPECTYMGYYAFNATSLISAEFPKLTSMENPFGSCITIQKISLAAYSRSLYSTTYQGTFKSTTFPQLISLYIPMCAWIDGGVFYNAYKLTSVNIDGCQWLSGTVFNSCYALSTISLPRCSFVNYAFYNCSNLNTVYLPACTSIGVGTFYGCTNLKSLYLLGSSVATLGSHPNSVFSSCMITNPVNGVYGSIFVPASLLASYKNASNWRYISARIVGV